MTQASEDDDAGPVEPGPGPAFRGRSLISPSIAVVVFALGILAGFPLAIFGFELLAVHAATVFAVLFAVFAIVVLAAVLILSFRRPIWERLFRFGQVEMDRFARPLSEVARFAAEQKVVEATRAAQDLAEMVLARYSWVVTRRWFVATLTAFIAAIAALAGAALLFQQNQLLSVQNQRVTEQVGLLRNQIELGEAQRSTSIVPEILEIGEALGTETAKRVQDGRPGRAFADYELSQGLQTRIIAATNAARPYRYLATLTTAADASVLGRPAVTRRPELVQLNAAAERWRQTAIDIYGAPVAQGELIDRPVSPERGQIIQLLFGSRVLETEFLSFFGADFSFAEVRLPILANMSLQNARLRYADFSTNDINTVTFGGSDLTGARFRFAIVSASDFSGIPGDEIKPPNVPSTDIAVWTTWMADVDFRGAVITDTRFDAIHGMGLNFDGTVMESVSFKDSYLGAATFRNAILGTVDFSGADMSSVDFDGAIVFDADFLDRVAEAAKPETFVRARFEMQPVADGERDVHPRSDNLWRIPEGETRAAFRLVRIGEFS